MIIRGAGFWPIAIYLGDGFWVFNWNTLHIRFLYASWKVAHFSSSRERCSQCWKRHKGMQRGTVLSENTGPSDPLINQRSFRHILKDPKRWQKANLQGWISSSSSSISDQLLISLLWVALIFPTQTHSQQSCSLLKSSVSSMDSTCHRLIGAGCPLLFLL